MDLLAKAADDGELGKVKQVFNEEACSQAQKDLALARACCNGHIDVAEFLYQNGADPNGQYESEKGKFEYGPILLASCEFLNPTGVKWLLNHGANAEGYPSGSEAFQCLTPLEMVEQTYVDHEENKIKCKELLKAAIQSKKP